MKIHLYSPRFFLQHRQSPKSFYPVVKRIDSATVMGYARQQRKGLLGLTLFLILCWTIGAIWLISVRRGEDRSAEVLARRGIIAMLSVAEMVHER